MSQTDLIHSSFLFPASLKDIRVWQYARIITELQNWKESESDEESVTSNIQIIATCLEVATSAKIPAFEWQSKYNKEFVVECFNRLSKIIESGLPGDSIEAFTFTTLTPDDTKLREASVKKASILNRSSLRSDLKIDSNRTYTVITLGNQTFEQIIYSDRLMKELVVVDADITVRDFSKLPRLLAMVTYVEGDQFHYYDKNVNEWRFNTALVDYREKVLMHIDIETAWKAYNAFFLTVRERSRRTRASGRKLWQVLRRRAIIG